jgi:8-oxo-dGTP diphosphatase
LHVEKVPDMITEVKFYKEVEDHKLKFAVIISRTQGKWVLCKHKDRDTYEAPGGHREPGEAILVTAMRELQEETGAIDFELRPVCVYSVSNKRANGERIGEETFGMLCFAEIQTFEKELHSEIESIWITKHLPDNWTYPDIQPKLLKKVKQLGYL